LKEKKNMEHIDFVNLIINLDVNINSTVQELVDFIKE
jgi:hypothetical protein